MNTILAKFRFHDWSEKEAEFEAESPFHLLKQVQAHDFILLQAPGYATTVEYRWSGVDRNLSIHFWNAQIQTLINADEEGFPGFLLEFPRKDHQFRIVPAMDYYSEYGFFMRGWRTWIELSWKNKRYWIRDTSYDDPIFPSEIKAAFPAMQAAKDTIDEWFTEFGLSRFRKGDY